MAARDHFLSGVRVRFVYSSAAVSCQSSHRIEGEGIVRAYFSTTCEPPIGIERPGLSRLTCVFLREITHITPLAF